MLCSMALPPKLCAALHNQSNVGLMCYCKQWRSLDLSVLVGILSAMVQVPERTTVQTQGKHYVQKKEDHADQ